MKKFNYILVLAITAIVSLASCKNEKQPTTNQASHTPAKKFNPNKPTAPKGPLTTVAYEGPAVYDFGQVNDGEVVNHVFRMKNTGKEFLVITGATSTCGCTVPQPPKEPIAPGEIAEIKVKFNTSGKGKRDGGVQTNVKKITVTANTAKPTIFTLRGNVNKIVG